MRSVDMSAWCNTPEELAEYKALRWQKELAAAQQEAALEVMRPYPGATEASYNPYANTWVISAPTRIPQHPRQETPNAQASR